MDYTEEEFDQAKSKVLKYIMYKKRTEAEIRRKFQMMEETMLDDVIDYLKEVGYINDQNYLDRALAEFMNIHTLSIREIQYKLLAKGLTIPVIENYFDQHQEELAQYEYQSAKTIYNKKLRNMEPASIFQFLRKKGYRDGTIRRLKEEESV